MAPKIITKEMWTVVVKDGNNWSATDIYADTEAEVLAVLNLIRQNAARDIKPERWTVENSRIVPCTVNISLFNIV